MDELDGELRARADEGDREAIGRLLERQTPRVRAVVLAVGIAPGDADDLVQEALTRALAHWCDPGSERAFAAWLATIARNVAIDFRRRRERERDRIDGRDPETIAEPSRGAAPTVEAERDAAAIPGLAADALAILQLRYGKGLSGREIAEQFGISREAMKKRLQRARTEALARLRGRRS